MSGTAGVVVPVRSFQLGKARLAGSLDETTRVALARRLADGVVDAAGSWPVVVVTSAPEVRSWAEARSLPTIADPGSLDAAAAAGHAWLAARGATRVVVAHADLPFARSLEPLVHDAGRAVAVLVPCHRDDGTNVLSIPADGAFAFAYGPGSFRRHAAAARAAGLAVRVVRARDLAVDVDLPEDLALVELGRG